MDASDLPGGDETGGKPESKSGKSRATKTPLQKEVLEASYQLNAFPSEEHRRALGERIGLTEQQVQVWYTNRRRRDKKQEAKQQAAASLSAGGTPCPEAAPVQPSPAAVQPHPAAAAAPPPQLPLPTFLQGAASKATPQARPGASPAPPAATPGLQLQQLTPAAAPAPDLPGSALQSQQSGPAVPPCSTSGLSLTPTPGAGLAKPKAPGSAPARPPLPLNLASATRPPLATPAAPSLSGVLARPPSAPLSAAPSAQPSSPGSDTDEDESAAPGKCTTAVAQQWEQYRELLEAAKAALPVPFREDGPPLAFEFDPLPDPKSREGPAAAGAPKRKRIMLDDCVAEADEAGVMGVRKKKPTVPKALLAPGQTAQDYEMKLEMKRRLDIERAEKKRLEDERRSKKENDKAEALRMKLESSMKKEQERLRKELAKHQERLEKERKREEEERQKEMERIEKEKRKLQERIEKEKAKEESRRLREAEKARSQQEKELRKLEAQREKEKAKEEKRKMMDEKRREKELARALAQQEKAAMRQRLRDTGGPPDDLDLEMERLLEAQAQAAETRRARRAEQMQMQLAAGGAEGQMDVDMDGFDSDEGEPVRPEFPPASLALQPAFPEDMGDDVGSDILMVWNFLHSFSDLLGVPPCSVDDLARALYLGEASQLLAATHVALLRLLQADMEEAHAAYASTAAAAAAHREHHHHHHPGSDPERASIGISNLLDEAWAWGFDIDAWRCHLSPLTWPEVLRQVAIVAGAGPKRPKPRKDIKPKLGEEGEDLAGQEGEGPVVTGVGGLKLRMPPRFAVGTVKGAAWQVLTEVGPEGLTINEVARRIQKAGLRDLRTSKTPEATVAGALSRDAVFTRVAPATYALSSVISHSRKPQQQGAAGDQAQGGAGVKAEAGAEAGSGGVKPEAATPGPGPGPSSAAGSQQQQGGEAEGEDDYSSDDEEEDEEEEEGAGRGQGSAWVEALKQGDYSQLGVRERLAALLLLCHLLLDGPSVRAKLEMRVEEAQAVRKQLFEEAKAEKRRKQQEAAARARQAAEDAARRLEELQRQVLGQPPLPPPEPREGSAGPAAAGGEQGLNDEEERRKKAQRAETLRKVEEENAIRVEPLGLDRRFNRYWRFCYSDAAGQDPGAGRIYVESGEDGSWRLLGSAGQLEGLRRVLEPRGAREGVLHGALVRHCDSIVRCMPAGPLPMPPGLEGLPEGDRAQLVADYARRVQSLPCQAQAALDEEEEYVLDLARPGQARGGPLLLKLQQDMLRVEAALPPDASSENFNRYAWIQSVQEARTAADLRQSLGVLESSIRPEFVAPGYPLQPQLVRGAWLHSGREVASAVEGPGEEAQEPPEHSLETGSSGSSDEPLSWMPPTVAAVALRLQALDAAIMYNGSTTGRDYLAGYKYLLRPAPAAEPSKAELGPGSRLQQQQASTSGAGDGAAQPGFKPQVMYGPTTLGVGRIRPVLLFPHLPGEIMHIAARDYDPGVEELRRAVQEAEAEGLMAGGGTTWLTAASQGARSGKAVSGKGGRSGQAPQPPQPSGPPQPPAPGRKPSKPSKKSSHKKKSALARELERQEESEEDDWDHDQDQDQDEQLEAGGYMAQAANPYQAPAPQARGATPGASVYSDDPMLDDDMAAPSRYTAYGGYRLQSEEPEEAEPGGYSEEEEDEDE